MANVNTMITILSRKQSRGAGYKRWQHKIDMTPMVDLGFLLITFFIFNATMSDPTTISLAMPKDGRDEPVAASGAFSVLIGSKGKIYFYEGPLHVNADNLHETNLTSLRMELIRKKKQVIAQYVPDVACEAKAIAVKPVLDCSQDKLMVLIKPTDNADYRDIIHVLDEMAIHKIGRYALVDPDASEQHFLL